MKSIYSHMYPDTHLSLSKRPFFLIVFLFCATLSVRAQSADSLGLYRDFLSICTKYQVAPLQVNITYSMQTNLVVNNSDTSIVQGYFQLMNNKDAYMRFGEVEQLITDSAALWVNHSLKQVIINEDVAEARKRVNMYTGGMTSDSSALNMAKVFVAKKSKRDEGEIAIIELDSRSRLSYTDEARQSIVVLYNHTTGEPVEITTVRRTLIPIAREDSAAFVHKYGSQGKVISVPKIGPCFVREFKGVYSYANIRHNEEKELPINLSDYLIKNEKGEYILTSQKKDYFLKRE